MSKILLCVTGSISCYKAAELTSLLTKKGHEVKVLATEDALRFVGKATFEGLSKNKIYTDLWSNDDEPIAHISLSQKWADAIIVYPASADTINKLAAGIADNLLGALFLANNFTKPFILAPAMNTNMFMHPATQKALQTLKDWGTKIMEPGQGHLACGDKGVGRLPEASEALEFLEKVLN
ncbi:MAG: flavoprotein [Treponema sp.]|nr:flavoprotein [Treponema sp.]